MLLRSGPCCKAVNQPSVFVITWCFFNGRSLSQPSERPPVDTTASSFGVSEFTTLIRGLSLFGSSSPPMGESWFVNVKDSSGTLLYASNDWKDSSFGAIARRRRRVLVARDSSAALLSFWFCRFGGGVAVAEDVATPVESGTSCWTVKVSARVRFDRVLVVTGALRWERVDLVTGVTSMTGTTSIALVSIDGVWSMLLVLFGSSDPDTCNTFCCCCWLT